MKHHLFQKQYHLMLLPGMLLLIIFSVIPMVGIVLAFQDFKMGLGLTKSPWIGFENFKYLFDMRDSKTIFFNTINIAFWKIIANSVIPLIFAILLNEVSKVAFKRWVQTIVYLPHFLSWVILSGIIIDLLSLDGVVNNALQALGMEPIMFLGNNTLFPWIIISSDVWKEFGFNAIIFLAALTGISLTLYEAAEIDGASWLQKLRHVTLPGIAPTIVLLGTLSIGNILNAGFDQIFNLYNPLVYESGDIIDTYVYRVGIVQAQFGLATAVGLMKSVIALILIVISYRLAGRFANYRIF
ncbi:ABC transporter permease subunit [Paenibacillus sp. LHD-38]|uniref:ABC transporter permease n=1 Tax=Paenibacillus sp. LHD-38 TaxID=3072143 RepID=UPI00280F6DD6|nr:ABC transporter permease subunit [Paenibacillus sp. LHD-38]MDQ8736785.1 ABC transporter permease subunit [Paenibacillus sp. LHD-38]